MQGLGFCTAMIPLLRKIYKGDDEAMIAAMKRQSMFFNTDHDFGGMILGICASMEDRVKRIMERYELGERSAKEAIREMDKSRRQYYEKYTDRKWGDRSAHQVIFNVSLLGMENTVNAIRAMYLAMDGIDEVLE